MDREWMYVGNRVSQRFVEGLRTFLDMTTEYKKPRNMSDVHYICCPCDDCCNEKNTRDIEEIREHVLVGGFMSEYTCWMEHGEYKDVVLEDTDLASDDDVDQMNHCWTEQNMARQDTNVGGGDDVDDLDEMLRNVESEFSGKSQNNKFSQIMKDYDTPLFSGCIVLILLQIKDSNDWSDKGPNELLQFFKDLLPKANLLPQSTYQAKKIDCLLGLEVEKIHAYQNDCMLFHNEDAMLEECLVCRTSRYK
jgi:hypothetical protein